MAKNQDGYLSAKESRRISKENRRITDQYEKRRKRRNVPESEYTTQMKDPANAVEFDNLHTYFFTDTGVVKSVDGVSFEVPIGKTVGVVGESGCGKSVTSLSLMQLLQRPQGQIVEGAIRLNLGNDKAYDIAKTPADKMQGLRGNYISMIFQEPMTSLNPVFRIGAQIDEVIALHEGEGKTKEDIKKRTIEMLEMVGIANSEGVYAMYPHELSGGMRQRVMIAMALACNPKLLIADEPTTALDVTIQAQILDLLRRLRDDTGMAVLLITHDLGVVSETADRVVVMYCGQVVEEAEVRTLFDHPMHPYTLGLLKSIPRLEDDDSKRLYMIKGMVPNPLEMPPGCHFSDRCDSCMDICRTKVPELVDVDGHKVRCFLYESADGEVKSEEAIARAEAEALADVEAAREVETAEALLAAEDLREAEIEEIEKEEEASR